MMGKLLCFCLLVCGALLVAVTARTHRAQDPALKLDMLTAGQRDILLHTAKQRNLLSHKKLDPYSSEVLSFFFFF